jgi:type IX secretion system PorP/SprF family membrane protein
MMARKLLLGILILSAANVHAQYFQFSQYNFSAQRVSPTAPASTDYATLGLLYRNQGTASDINLSSNFLSSSYPLITRNGRRWSGVGITIMDDRSGGIFSLQEASLSYAVNIPVNKFESLSFGVKGLYQQRKVDLEGLHTGSQYVTDRGFDESLSSGEHFGMLRTDYFTFSTGLAWQHVDKRGVRIAYWNVSLFDFNKPTDSFLGIENELSSTWVASGGFRAASNDGISIFPEALVTRSTGNTLLNAGIVTRLEMKQGSRKEPFYLDVISKYVIGRSAILGVQFNRENFSVGFSYDAPIHRSVANVGAFEVGLEFRKLVNPLPKRRVAAKTNLKPAESPKKTAATTAKSVQAKSTSIGDSVKRQPVKKSLASTLQHKHDSVVANVQPGKLSHLPFEIEKVILHFNFEFNSSNLDDESTTYLDELVEALKENAHLRIKLVGHTDNIGSAHFNQRLSVYRANAIKEYMVTKGVELTRIETDGKGMSQPLNANRTEEDRAKNRRVELMILYAE